jgi:hypothetical protein
VLDREALSEARGVEFSERAQISFPYLRSPRYRFGSSCGVLAGGIAASARDNGVWRSVAGRPLSRDAAPSPSLPASARASLRDELDLGVFGWCDGALQLDDERCQAPYWQNSAEVVRFIGWLRRELTRLGEALVFHSDTDDPRPLIALAQFGEALYRAGALDGAQPEDGFAVRRLPEDADNGRLAYEIRVAPAYPIDQIVLTFVHTRDRWSLEVGRG